MFLWPARGALILHTDPPGAQATLRPFEWMHRRLVPVAPRDLGRTPLDGVPLAAGSYLVELSLPGREADALRFAPRQRSGTGGEAGPLLVGRAADGRFALVPDAEGDVWDASWPVLMVDWFGAVAYADWFAARTNLPWRLPVELEWERAARGSDRRAYVWGDFADPSWCANLAAFDGRALPMPVGRFPVDTSVFGVRGLAGNVRDWTLDPQGGPRLDGQRVAVPAEVDRESLELRPRRGGAWLTCDAESGLQARPGAR